MEPIMQHHSFVIIIPSYMRSDLLKRALDSIKTQGYENWNCVVINDGSTDKTESIVKKYVNHDHRVHYLKQENSGVNVARNTGIEYAKSKFDNFYYLFIDDDDYLAEDCLSKANNSILEQPDYKWHGFNCINSDKTAKKISRIKSYGPNNYISDLMFGQNWRGDITSFIHNSLVDDLRFCQEFKNGEEWYFWSQLAVNNDTLISDTPGSFKDYLPTGLTKSGFNRDKAIQVLKFKLKILSPIVSETKMIHQVVSLAKNLYQQGNKVEARKYLFQAFSINPLYLRQYPHWIKQLFY